MKIERRSWYVIGATSHFGYPQPEDDYRAATYDSAGYCARCGIGTVQRRPFRFRSEPRARHSHFLQLNWIFDEFFVRPEVRVVFLQENIEGIGFTPAVRHRGGQALESIEQLTILTILQPGLETHGLEPVTCRPNNEEATSELHNSTSLADLPYCGRVKYHWPSK